MRINKIEKIILQNQQAILHALFRMCNVDEVNDNLRKQNSKTLLALEEWKIK